MKAKHLPGTNRRARVYYGDTKEVMDRLITRTPRPFDAIVTSPPYFGQRSSGEDEREVGHSGQSLRLYLQDLSFTLYYASRLLAPNGLLWLNIADTKSGSGGAGGDYNRGGSKSHLRKWKQGETGLADRQDCLVPESVKAALQYRGWLIRATIIWDKQRLRREDIRHAKRPLPGHEYVILAAKGPELDGEWPHLWNAEAAIAEPELKGTVWRFPPKLSGASQHEKHSSPFPDELVRRCLTLTRDTPGSVLDPFCGSGTTLRVANEMGWRSTGIELYPECGPELRWEVK